MVLSKIVAGTVLALVLQGAGAMTQKQTRPTQPSPNFRQPSQVPDELDLSRSKPSDKRRAVVHLIPIRVEEEYRATDVDTT